jgi:hypothetical protein
MLSNLTLAVILRKFEAAKAVKISLFFDLRAD